MEQDKIATLCGFLDTVNKKLNEHYIILDEPLTIKDVRSPLTLIGVDGENLTYIIMRGYKAKSLINRYAKISDASHLFFIIDVKNLALVHYRLEVIDVSTKYFI